MGQIFSSSGGRDDDDEVIPPRPTKKAKTEHNSNGDTPNFVSDHLPNELMHADDAVEDEWSASSSTSPPYSLFLSVTSAGCGRISSPSSLFTTHYLSPEHANHYIN